MSTVPSERPIRADAQDPGTADHALPDLDDPLFTIAETAKKLRTSERQVHRKIRSGDLVAFKLGRLWRIPGSSIRDLLRRSRYRPTAKGGRS